MALGKLDESMACLDEAMAGSLGRGGGLEHRLSTSCHMLPACAREDLQRAVKWCRAADCSSAAMAARTSSRAASPSTAAVAAAAGALGPGGHGPAYSAGCTCFDFSDTLPTREMWGVMKRGLLVALVMVVLLMGVVVMIHGPVNAARGSGGMYACTACFAVLIVAATCVVGALRYLLARPEVFAALWHPSPSEPPPRLA